SINDGNTTQLRKGMVVAVEPFATNGHGMIRSAKPGNIYKIAKERPMNDTEMKEFYDMIAKEFKTFPFCERWIDHPRSSQMLNKLLRHGLITQYAQLTEVKKGCVTQSEHTAYIDEKKALITTLL
ncbi:MAG: type II methionyl aminopeptidase, partial [Methanomassiliicoccaceae archaeon]|nr:type II methionyl aminopeptidase [Methanomassiliicoccaceae archaeon]